MTDLSARGIPILDMALVDSDPEGFAKSLGDGCREYGFFGVTNHGIPTEVISATVEAARELFALPEDTKKKYEVPGGGGQRGYTPFGIETAKDSSHFDLKEFWHVGRENVPALGPNVWVDEQPDFKETSLAFFNAMDDLGRRILKSFALYLRQQPDFFDHAVDRGNSILRLIHYPPIEDLETPHERAGAHGDINVITLLVGADQPGLEVIVKDTGDWLPVLTGPDTIVCNIGDMLERLTNNLLPSTTHRVINPPGKDRLIPRYSIPYFLHFNSDFEIKTLDSCIAENKANAYPEAISADDFLQQRLREIGLK